MQTQTSNKKMEEKSNKKESIVLEIQNVTIKTTTTFQTKEKK